MSWGSWESSSARPQSNPQAASEDDPWKAWADSWGPQAKPLASLSAATHAAVNPGGHSGGTGAADDWNAVRLEVGLRVRNPKTCRAGAVTAVTAATAGCFWVKFDDGDTGEREISKFVSEADGLALEAPGGNPSPAQPSRPSAAARHASPRHQAPQPKAETAAATDHWGKWKGTAPSSGARPEPERGAPRVPDSKAPASELDSWPVASSWSSWQGNEAQAQAKQAWPQDEPSSSPAWGEGAWGTEGSKGGGREAQRPDLYIGDAPGHFEKDTIIAMHRDAGLDTSVVTGVKILPQKAGAGHPTRSIIVNYRDYDAASVALEKLKTWEVSVGGKSRVMSIRFADPMKKAGGGADKDKWPAQANEWSAPATEWSASANATPPAGGGGADKGKWPAQASERSALATEWSASANATPPAGGGGADKDKWPAQAKEWSAPATDWSASANATPPASASTPLVAGLRIRNRHTWRTGVALAILASSNVRICFDDGEEAERAISMFETETGGELTEASTGPVLLVVGLRVRNYQNHRAGTVEAISDKHFEITFDGGEKAWRHMQMFEAEDGRELTAEAPVAVPAAPASVQVAVGLRVRSRNDHRAGTVKAVSDKSCEITFDDGEEGWRYVEMFEAEDGRDMTAVASVDVPAAPASVPVAVGLRVKNPANGRCGVVAHGAVGPGNFRVKFDDGDVLTRPIINFTAERDGAPLAEGAWGTAGEKEASRWSNDGATAWDAAESGGKKGGADRRSKDTAAGWEAAGAVIEKTSDWQQAESCRKATSNKADAWATGGWESSGVSGWEGEAGKKGHGPSKWSGTDSWWQDTPGRGQQKGGKDTLGGWDAPTGRGDKGGARSSTPRRTNGGTGKDEKRSTTPTKGSGTPGKGGARSSTPRGNHSGSGTAGKGYADTRRDAGESEATGTGQADVQRPTGSAGSEERTAITGTATTRPPPGLELERSQLDESLHSGEASAQGGSDFVPPAIEAVDSAGLAQADPVQGARSMGGDAPGDIDSEQLRALVEQADKYGAKVRELVKAQEEVKALQDASVATADEAEAAQTAPACETKDQDESCLAEVVPAETAQVVPTCEIKDQGESCLAEVSEMKDQEECTPAEVEPDSNETKDDEGAAQEKVVPPPDESALLDASAASDELAHTGDHDAPRESADPAEPRLGELKQEEPEAPEAQLKEAEPEAAATQTTLSEFSPERPTSEEPPEPSAEEPPKPEPEGKAAAEHEVAEAEEVASQRKEEHGHEPAASDAIDES